MLSDEAWSLDSCACSWKNKNMSEDTLSERLGEAPKQTKIIEDRLIEAQTACIVILLAQHTISHHHLLCLNKAISPRGCLTQKCTGTGWSALCSSPSSGTLGPKEAAVRSQGRGKRALPFPSLLTQGRAALLQISTRVPPPAAA